jgi:hypothetical protein
MEFRFKLEFNKIFTSLHSDDMKARIWTAVFTE